MPPDAEASDLKRQVAELMRRLDALENMRVDEASGGGQLTVNESSCVLRINSLTNSGQQLP